MSIATDSYANPQWDFADRLRKVRRAVANMTQAEMAVQLGVTTSAYEAWESGRNKPDDIVAIAKRIAMRWRGVTAAWVLGVEDSHDPGPDGGVVRPKGFEPLTFWEGHGANVISADFRRAS